MTEGDAHTEGYAAGYGVPAVVAPDYSVETFVSAINKVREIWQGTPFLDAALDGFEMGREARCAR